MNSELIHQILEICIIPFLGIIISYFIKTVNLKIADSAKNQKNEDVDKYIQLLDEIIINCVIATTQTYVNSLKESGKFDSEAQKTAFNKTYEAVVKILTDEAIATLETVIGDLKLYITQKIETEVNLNKNGLAV